MDKTANVKATEIAPEAREWLAGVLRVDLRDGDEVTLTLHRTPEEEQTLRRERARQRLVAFFAATDERTRGVPDAEMDAAIDEAMTFVRSRPAN